jgi:hypothetical protein
MTDPKYPHLNLLDWPFQVVASTSTADVWVGRPDTHRRLERVERSASRIPASRIVLLWASFGSGKTHALLHLAHLAAQHEDLVPLYVVTPKGVRSFVDVYKAIADAALESSVATDAGRWLFEHRERSTESDVERALLRLAAYGKGDSETAAAWIRAQKVPMRDLHQIGITARIETAADAVTALNRLIAAMQQGGAKKLILLLDEVQELEDLGKRLSECMGGLHKVFDHNTEGLTMVLSFTTGTQAALRGILGEALFDRASLTLTLPPLRPGEAVDFVGDLVRAWSIDTAKTPYPFTDEAIKAVIHELEERGATLTPRTVIKAFNQILLEAEADIEDRELDVIDAAFAIGALSDDVT